MFALRKPFARLKSIIACGMLVLYTGMMLGGESLHLLLGCEHAGPAATSIASAENATSDANTPSFANGVRFVHDEDSCPICQFHAQGQLAPSLASNPLRQVLATSLPMQPKLILAAAAPGVYSPRGPPLG
jgi:hypothetical protein